MKEIQDKIKKFCEENNLNAPIEHRVLDLVSEVGEVAKEVLKMTDYGNKDLEYREEMKAELGDTLYVLAIIANHFNINLDEALTLVLEKYEKRLKKGSMGSEVD